MKIARIIIIFVTLFVTLLKKGRKKYVKNVQKTAYFCKKRALKWPIFVLKNELKMAIFTIL